MESSIFCDNHRDAAARFSLAFGRQTAEPAAAPRGASDGENTDISPPPHAATTSGPAEAVDDEREALATAFHAAFVELRQREAAHEGPERWPQLSIYLLDDVLHCRAYFSIVPRADAKIAGNIFALDDDRVHAAVAVGGVVFEAVQRLYDEHAAELKRETLQTLDVHFLTYAGLVAINAHPPGGKPANLLTFVLRGDGFHEVELDEGVRARMSHNYW